jgi:hypothetical protein
VQSRFVANRHVRVSREVLFWCRGGCVHDVAIGVASGPVRRFCR